jgi:hypothetical protein
VRAPQRAAERPELLAAEPINVYHWAAVALVTGQINRKLMARGFIT